MSLEDNPTSFFLSANPSWWSFLIGIDLLLCSGFNEFLGRTQQPQNSGHHINNCIGHQYLWIQIKNECHRLRWLWFLLLLLRLTLVGAFKWDAWNI